MKYVGRKFANSLTSKLHMPTLLFLLIFNIALGIQHSNAQMLQTGAWKTHLSYQRLTNCEATSRCIYAASEQGFFRVKESTSELE